MSTRFLETADAAFLLGVDEAALRMRRMRGMPPPSVVDTASRSGRRLYELKDLMDLAQQHPRMAAKVAEMARTGRTLRKSNRRRPLPDPILEKSAHDLALLLLEADDAELAARCYVAANVTAESVGKHTGCTPETARTIRAGFAQRVGFLVSRRV